MPALLALFLLLGCGASQSPVATEDSEAPTATDERSPRYTTRGTIEEIREERGQIIVHHENIPGYMPEMTMPFLIEDPALFQGLAVGQRIELTFSVEPGGRHVARVIRRL